MFKPKSYVCKWCGKRHYKGSKVARQHKKLLKMYGLNKKRTFDFYKIQCKTSKNAKWETPRLKANGKSFKNKFKTKFQARKWYWKYGMHNYKKPLYALRFKGFNYKRRS